ncbi:hypothetical protein [Vibrio lentus]|uniref:Uncharacterized protein n=1 Tax=Vibrio lentus TaxID=136468 RepID=A0A2N7IE85_9VIBR|nr:hypothetical protein [Vibrio lentus]PML55305.1 hypothetical protein BCT74_08225 [Vibrio lentus]
MARIKKKSVDEFYSDVDSSFLKYFRKLQTSIGEMCNSGYGALLLDKLGSTKRNKSIASGIFCAGRYSEDRNNIFISENVLKLLEKSSFDNIPDSKVRLPFKTFKIRFPKSSGLGACIFTVSRSSYIGFLGGKASDVDESKEHEAIFITTTDSIQNGKRTFKTKGCIIDKLLTSAAKQSDTYDTQTKTHDLAVKFCILHSTGAISMEDGHPLPTKYDKPKQGGKSFRFGFNNAEFNNEAFVRPHFRNLRDERYYKKEPYNEWERGSRWTFVTGKTINAKSYTTTNTTT